MPYPNGTSAALLDSHEDRIQKLEDSTSTLLQSSVRVESTLDTISLNLSDVKGKLDGHDEKLESLSTFVQDMHRVEDVKKSRNRFITGGALALIGAGGGGFFHWLWVLISAHVR